MSQIEIFSEANSSRYSKLFRVDVGKVVVISSFNFACEKLDDTGEVTRKGDCAILHKVDLEAGAIPQRDACGGCGTCVLNGLESRVEKSEPVVQCGNLWTHNSQNNLSVLSVPGYYMFEVCDEQSIGALSIKIEELSLDEAKLLPEFLYHGA